jgi:LacI family transcriptional regulator
MASILDIAREASVAPSSVSLVLNGKPGVSDALRQKVEAAMRKLGHKPKTIQTSRNVAFIYTPNMLLDGALFQYCRDWIKSAREALADSADSFTVLEGHKNAADDPMFNASLEDRDFDAVILMGAYPAHGYIQRVLEAKVPLVVLDRRPEHDEFNCVCVDHRGLGRQAAQHLLSLGHQRVSLVTADAARYPGCHIREGFKAGLAHANLNITLDMASDALNNQTDHIVDQILASNVTAVFSGDPGCRRIAEKLHTRGVRVPHDISLIGFDDLKLLTPEGKKISSLGYDKKTMGHLAGQMLTQIWDMPGRLTAMQAIVPCHLVPGDTVCAPRL